MGLFDAFKKKDKKKQDDLDLPPPPPSLEAGDMGNELPDFPDMGTASSQKSKGNSKDEFDFSQNQEIDDMKMPDFPDISDMDMGPITAPDDKLDGMDWTDDDLSKDGLNFEQEPATKPAPLPPPAPKAQQQLKPAAVQQAFAPKPYVPKVPSRPVVSSGSTYLKVDNFRLMLGTIASARSEIRKSEESLAKLESIKASKDKSFDKVKSSLEDIQKKLIFIDKTLFKGE